MTIRDQINLDKAKKSRPLGLQAIISAIIENNSDAGLTESDIIDTAVAINLGKI